MAYQLAHSTEGQSPVVIQIDGQLELHRSQNIYTGVIRFLLQVKSSNRSQFEQLGTRIIVLMNNFPIVFQNMNENRLFKVIITFRYKCINSNSNEKHMVEFKFQSERR